jgi:hypothetical protein
MLIILAPWEAEIRRVADLDWPQPKKFSRPYLSGKKLGMVAHVCYHIYGWEV